jgi:ApbE superfamily uncharacterized protein (UPF0280 family)
VTAPPQAALLADGRRLHLQHGPIDLIIEAFAPRGEIWAAYDAAIERFATILDSLCDELPLLRAAAQPDFSPLRGPVALRMHRAVAPHAGRHFITPMAAVAGAVAEEVLAAMTGQADLQRAYVNNGGDIALHLKDGERFAIGMVADPTRDALSGRVVLAGRDGIKGIATSGWRGRSFSLGIADAVTVLASTASVADAAATIIANAVDLPGHPAIERIPADHLQPDSDLGGRLVTRAVGALAPREIDLALASGASVADQLIGQGLIKAAALHLQQAVRSVGGVTIGENRELTHA